jgi:23S rRNA U2552 (ribose-2'-O)-methylase RlmE/FtsJ
VLANRLYESDEARQKASEDYRVVSVDLQEMAAIEGVYILQGDITTEQTLN